METYESWKSWISGTMQSAVAPLQLAAPSVTTTMGARRLLGTKPEKAGYTSTGGRRTTKKAPGSKRRH